MCDTCGEINNFVILTVSCYITAEMSYSAPKHKRNNNVQDYMLFSYKKERCATG